MTLALLAVTAILAAAVGVLATLLLTRASPIEVSEAPLNDDIQQRFDELVARAADIRGYL
jgi:hypothetical protein